MTKAARAIEVGRALLGRCVYRMGGKLATVLAPEAVRKGAGLDCSGFVAYCLRRARVVCPDGSVNQFEWASDGTHGHSVPVAFALGAEGAGCLLFIHPHGGEPGHVALSLGNGETIESHGPAGSTEPSIVGAERNAHRGWQAASKVKELFEQV